MSLRMNSASMAAMGQVIRNRRAVSKSLARLSSGMRIHRAADDAAGLGVATNLETRIQSNRQAMRNINDGISVIPTAEGAIGELVDIAMRLRELAVQAASDTLADDERQFIYDEDIQLVDEWRRIARSTEFNGTLLLDGTADINVQVGIHNTPNDRIAITIADLDPNTILGLPDDTHYPSFETAAGARSWLDDFGGYIQTLSAARSQLGAVQNRFESALSHATTHTEALSAAESRIRDTDYATETSRLAKLQLIEQAGIASLAQAKGIDRSILDLIAA